MPNEEVFATVVAMLIIAGGVVSGICLICHIGAEDSKRQEAEADERRRRRAQRTIVATDSCLTIRNAHGVVLHLQLVTRSGEEEPLLEFRRKDAGGTLRIVNVWGATKALRETNVFSRKTVRVGDDPQETLEPDEAYALGNWLGARLPKPPATELAPPLDPELSVVVVAEPPDRLTAAIKRANAAYAEQRRHLGQEMADDREGLGQALDELALLHRERLQWLLADSKELNPNEQEHP